MSNAVILLCAGRSTRMRGVVADKVLAPLGGRPVLEYSLRAFLAARVAQVFIFVTRSAAQRATIARLAAPLLGATAEVLFTLGGKERQDSVERGLRLVPEAVEYVFIHDCARPLVTPASLRALLAAVRRDDAAVLAHRATDTIKQTPPRPRGLRRLLLRDLRRDTLWAMETPQVFARELAQQAYLQVRQKKLRVTDDVAAVAALGHAVTLVENHAPNPKLTRPEDFAWAEALVKSRDK